VLPSNFLGSCVRQYLVILLALSASVLWAQPPSGEVPATVVPAETAPPAIAPDATGPVVPLVPVEDKRAYGVLPNYRTAELSSPFMPLTSKQKLTIAAKDSFDGAVYPTALIMSVIYQAEDANPSFGQGLKGYAKRAGTAFGDQMIGNMMTEGVMPTLLREDPRYFRIGEGPFGHRLWYAVTRTFVTTTDSHHKTFNFAEWSGNAVATSISNLYYQDGRTWQDNTERLVVQCGTDTLSNVLKEFWPDVKRHFQKKKD
jgi:hypothetical protein